MRLQAPLALRVAVFRLLEALSHLRHRPKPGQGHGASPAHGALWLYVATIGELNAVQPLLQPLLQALGHPSLVLLTHHTTYTDAYLHKYPSARVEVLDGSTSQAGALAKRCPPRMLVVAEIPCLLHDAPCRLSYATQSAARMAGAAVVLVNGWLYGYQPASRMDALESRLFSRDYVDGFDLLLVQTEAVRARLLAAGADPHRVHVTGNLKYDAMRAAAALAGPGPLSQWLRQWSGKGPLIVAGSVTETQVQRHLLQAFRAVLAKHRHARFVLAPRHPENLVHMQALHELLQESGVGHMYRSRTPLDQAWDEPVLILDTMGELRDAYAAADMAFVGTDHNVLEPLVHGTPVCVSGRWEPSYPSYPVYLQMLQAGAIDQVDDLQQLGGRWLERMDDGRRGRSKSNADLQAVLASAYGATQRNLAALQRHRLLT